MYKNVPSCLCCLEFRLCAAVVFFLVAIYLCAGVKENACVQSAVTRNSSPKQNKLKWELPGQKKPQIIHEGTTCHKTWLFAMLALAAVGFWKRTLATTSPTSVTTLERLFQMPASAVWNASLQPELQLFVRLLSGLTAPVCVSGLRE